MNYPKAQPLEDNLVDLRPDYLYVPQHYDLKINVETSRQPEILCVVGARRTGFTNLLGDIRNRWQSQVNSRHLEPAFPNSGFDLDGYVERLHQGKFNFPSVYNVIIENRNNTEESAFILSPSRLMLVNFGNVPDISTYSDQEYNYVELLQHIKTSYRPVICTKFQASQIIKSGEPECLSALKFSFNGENLFSKPQFKLWDNELIVTLPPRSAFNLRCHLDIE